MTKNLVLIFILVLPSFLLNSCMSNFEMGEEAFAIQNYEDALEFFEAAANLEPHNYNIYYNIGRCHEELEAYTKAMPFYSKSIRINKKFLEGYLGRARCSMKLGSYEGAIVDAKNILELDENHFVGNSIMAKCYYQEMSYGEAAHYFNLGVCRTFNNSESKKMGFSEPIIGF